jgi:hypothetical protein
MQDPEWLREIADFLNKNGNTEKFKVVKKVFVETYFESIREGMNSKNALEKAEMIAQSFIVLQ